MDRATPPPAAAAPEAFQSTAWTLVLEARTDGASRRAALERLCRTYWPPVFGYLRRRGYSPADAQDLTQGFFMELLESDFLDRSDPGRGRFRGFLIGALRRHLAREHQRATAQKRGGATAHAWATAEPEAWLASLIDTAPGPDDAYERAWAQALLARALARLEAEQAEAGRAPAFAALRACLGGDVAPGQYAEIARATGMPRTQVALRVHRLNQRLIELVRREVAETVADPTQVRAEMEHLRRALSR